MKLAIFRQLKDRKELMVSKNEHWAVAKKFESKDNYIFI